MSQYFHESYFEDLVKQKKEVLKRVQEFWEVKFAFTFRFPLRFFARALLRFSLAPLFLKFLLLLFLLKLM